jgi:hypothetical protein
MPAYRRWGGYENRKGARLEFPAPLMARADEAIE